MVFLRFKFLSLLVILANLSFAMPGQAAFILSFGTTSPNPLTVGQPGTMDVFVRTDAGTQVVDGFQVQIALTPVGAAPAGGVTFTNTQSDSQLSDGSANGYLFFGNSLSQATAAPIGTVTGGGRLFTGFDATNNFVPITLTTTARLLYRLDLTASAVGTYQIGVNALPNPSFFTDQLDPVNTGINFSSSTAQLTVNIAAVPEPSVTVTFGLAAIGMLKRRRGSRERS